MPVFLQPEIEVAVSYWGRKRSQPSDTSGLLEGPKQRRQCSEFFEDSLENVEDDMVHPPIASSDRVDFRPLPNCFEQVEESSVDLAFEGRPNRRIHQKRAGMIPRASQKEPTTIAQMETLVRVSLMAHVGRIPPSQFSKFTSQLSILGVPVGDKHPSAQFADKAIFLAARTVQFLD